MSFLRRLWGQGDETESPEAQRLRWDIATRNQRANGQFAYVTVGGVTIPATIHRDYARDVEDWSSDIRLEEPRTGRILTSEDDYTEEFRAAGARTTSVAGLSHHPDAQSDAFDLCQIVSLVPEPVNRVHREAIAVRSPDGRLLGGYVADDELAKLRATSPPPTAGLVVWERWTWRKGERTGLRLLVGPSVSLSLVPLTAADAEGKSRQARYEAGLEQERIEAQARTVAAEKVARESLRQQLAAEREQAAATRAAQVTAWLSQGLCVDCGAPVERTTSSRGRPPVRCERHRHSAES